MNAANRPTARSVAYEALKRIDQDGAYANLVTNAMLQRSGLDRRDRAFSTQLVYGTTRMRRACDFLVDRFLSAELEPSVRTLLRLGAYQLHFLDTASHAAVSETVDLAPRRVRGLINAVLRRVANTSVEWPSETVRLSYPDWLAERLSDDIGQEDSVAALRHMNLDPQVHERPDGYVQDPASRWVCDVVAASNGDRVLDACAAPGGKATLLASLGARVVALDRRLSRARLVKSNAENVAGSKAPGADMTSDVVCLVADARCVPLRGGFDVVLVDAPCSGLGVLRRRADARWRVDPDAIGRLSRLQSQILAGVTDQVAVGGRLVYSVCTMTSAETVEVAATIDDRFEPESVVAISGRFRPLGGYGGLVLPQDHDSDAMAVFSWVRIR